MTFENGDVLLCDVRIPNSSEVIGAACDQQIQFATEIKTFTSLKKEKQMQISSRKSLHFVFILLYTIEKHKVFSICWSSWWSKSSDCRHSKRLTNCYEERKRFFSRIHDESVPYNDIERIFRVLLNPKEKSLLKTSFNRIIFLLTSQKIRWLLAEPVLSVFVASFFRRIGSKRELIGFLKYKMWITPESSPKINIDSLFSLWKRQTLKILWFLNKKMFSSRTNWLEW